MEDKLNKDDVKKQKIPVWSTHLLAHSPAHLIAHSSARPLARSPARLFAVFLSVLSIDGHLILIVGEEEKSKEDKNVISRLFLSFFLCALFTFVLIRNKRSALHSAVNASTSCHRSHRLSYIFRFFSLLVLFATLLYVYVYIFKPIIEIRVSLAPMSMVEELHAPV